MNLNIYENIKPFLVFVFLGSLSSDINSYSVSKRVDDLNESKGIESQNTMKSSNSTTIGSNFEKSDFFTHQVNIFQYFST